MDKDAIKTIALPCCGYMVNAHQWLGGGDLPAKPEAGSLSICLKCGEVLVFVTGSELKVARALDCMRLSQEQRDKLFTLRRLIRERGAFK